MQNLVFLKKVLKNIKLIPAIAKNCNLVFDNMLIRKKIVYDEKEDKFVMYCEFGDIQVKTQEIPATETLFLCWLDSMENENGQ